MSKNIINNPTSFDKLLEQYDYKYPEHLIATSPSDPRESARLLVYNRKTDSITHTTFEHITDFLPRNSVLVFNQTKVIPARLKVTKPTGGTVTLLYLNHTDSTIHALSNKPLTPGMNLKIFMPDCDSSPPAKEGATSPKVVGGDCALTVLEKTTKGYLLKPNFPTTQIYDILEKHGTTPIPPYIKNPNLEEQKLREDYQTIFAKHQGSVAAPTASLHFSEKLIEKIKSAGIQIEYVTLHVGLGTFAPLTKDHIDSGSLHEEWYEVSTDTAERLNQAKEQGKIIIPVGTTSTRTLESASDENHKLKKLTGTTTLFIQENYQFKFADSIITNFHVPKSSLLMLVSAFATRKKLLEIYKTAITKNYKIFSFGDGMLIL